MQTVLKSFKFTLLTISHCYTNRQLYLRSQFNKQVHKYVDQSTQLWQIPKI